MGGSSFARAGVFLLAAPFLGGCSGCKVTNAPVSITGNTSSPAPDYRAFQSETSIARIDAMNASGQVMPHYVVTYNDATQTETPAPVNCWAFTGPNSLDGWATSDDFGATWARHTQLAPLAGGPFHARHGDTWTAAWNNPFVLQSPQGSIGFDGSVVLMVSVAQQGPGGYDGPWGLHVNRMIYFPADSTIDLTRDVEVALGPGSLPDGPKVAIRGDGTRAIVTWQPFLQYLQVKNLHQLTFFGPTPMTFGVQKKVDPMTAFGSPPDASCTGVDWVGVTHTQIAAGAGMFYAVGEWSYVGCKDPEPARLEVYRSPTGDTWERILSVRPPPQAAGVLPAHLNTQSIGASPRYSPSLVDRGDEGPSLAVGFAADGDYLLVVTDQTQPGDATRNEATRERVVQYRIPRADTCAADKRDLVSCDGVSNLPFQEVEGLAKPLSDLPSIASRAGEWESKPHVFTGNLSDGSTIDDRVGILWYTQPYKGLVTADDEMKARTIVEAVVSSDGGQTYSGPFNMLQGTSVEPDDPAIGVYFHPCQFLTGTACNSNGYYGEYITGAFQTSFPANLAIIGAWADSREGCDQQGLPTVHQHVWSGAIRSKDFQPPPTCGGQSQECCPRQPPCAGSLACKKGYCEPNIDLCQSCQTLASHCELGCDGDSACECACQNTLCSCQTSRGCTPHCQVKRCSEGPIP